MANNNNYAMMCDPAGLCHLADVAKVAAGATVRNAIVRFHTLRIQVLDYRSCQPVIGAPVAAVRIGKADGSDKRLLARYAAHNRAWDIEAHLPVYRDGANWYCGTKKVSLAKASQIAMNALGFDTGVPGNAYGQQGKTAWLRYRLEHGMLQLKPEDITALELDDADKKKLADDELNAAKTAVKTYKDASGADIAFNGPTDDQMKDVIARYNTRCYRAAQFHLAASGFFPPSDDPLEDFALDEHESGRWTSDWQAAFKRWRKAHSVSTAKAVLVKQSDAKKLKSTHKPFVTDQNGMLNIPVPRHMIPAGFSVEVEFLDFPVLGEATATERTDNKTTVVWRSHRLTPLDLAESGYPVWTLDFPHELRNLHIRWNGTQSLNPLQGWGWELDHDGSADQRQKSEFKTSWEFRIPAFEYGDTIAWSKMHDATQSLSLFYHPPSGTPEFVVFAMQWSQATYFEPPADADYLIEGASHEAPAGQRGDVTKPVMHAIAMPDPPPTQVMYAHYHRSDRPGGGRDYGMYYPSLTPWGGLGPRGNRPHKGFDLTGVDGDTPVFALTGGPLKSNYVSNGYGNCLIQKMSNGRGYLRYGHLSSVEQINGQSLPVGTRLKAGQHVGTQGRTFDANGPYRDAPTHLHLELKTTAALSSPTATMRRIREALPSDQHHDANRPHLPDNSMLRLFPCDTSGARDEPEKCIVRPGRTKASIASTCWALRELCCPYMPQEIDVATLEDAANANHRRRIQAQLVA